MRLAENLYAYPWTQPSVNNCNAYIIGGSAPALVDPGHAQLAGHIELGMSQDGLSEMPKLVLITHCHPDHLEAAFGLQRAGAKVAMSQAEAVYMDGEGRMLAQAMGMNMPDFQPDAFLDEGVLTVGEHELQVINTPGHSPGHVCFYWPAHKALFAGDLVFLQGVGRVDFPGGDGEKLKDSIRKVAALDIEWLLPGHGPAVKGAENIKRNFANIEKMYFGML